MYRLKEGIHNIYRAYIYKGWLHTLDIYALNHKHSYITKEKTRMSTYIGSRYHIPPFIPNPEIFCGYGIFPKMVLGDFVRTLQNTYFSNKKTGQC